MTGRRGVTPLGYRARNRWWNFHVPCAAPWWPCRGVRNVMWSISSSPS